MIPRREYRSETSWRCRQVTPRSDLTDIHCHCLPGLDDGPAAPVEALALCRALVADGIRRVVATPHQLGRFEGHYDAGAIRAAAGELSDRLREARIPLAVLPGADVRLDERIPQLLRSDTILTAADGRRYLLLELPHEVFIDPGTLLPELASMGVTAIITHPERHTHLARHPEYVRRWAEDGACLQITAGSFGGDFGRQSQKAAWAFIHAPLPILVATDAHDTSGRPPRLSEAYSLLAQEFGYIVADILCVENPCRVVEGRDLLMLTRSDLREEVVR
jgi:protein-tyrosine phosphatase